MKIEKLRELKKIEDDMNEVEYELNHVNDLIKNASGTCKVKINTRWIIELPASVLIEHAIVRKAELEDKNSRLEKKVDTVVSK